MDLELEIEVAPDREQRPQRHDDPGDDECNAEADERRLPRDLWPEMQDDDRVRDPRERGSRLGEPRGDLGRGAPRSAGAREHRLRRDEVRGERSDDHERNAAVGPGRGEKRTHEHEHDADAAQEREWTIHASASRSRSAEIPLAPVSSCRKYAYTSAPASRSRRRRDAHSSTSASVYPGLLRRRTYTNGAGASRVSIGDGARSPSACTRATPAVRRSSYTSS